MIFDVGKLLAYNSMFVFAPVAQLDRASVFGTEGWEFEPLRAHLFANFDLLSAPEALLDQILTNFAGLTTAASTAGYPHP